MPSIILFCFLSAITSLLFTSVSAKSAPSTVTAASNKCICDYSAAHRKLSYSLDESFPFISHGKKKVKYHDATSHEHDAKGTKFQRTKTPSSFYSAPSPNDASTFCSSEQIHITFGDNKGDMFVSFATLDFNTSSYVELAEIEEDLKTNSKNVESFYGSSIAYSEQISVNCHITNGCGYPTMGKPLMDASDIIKLQNTANWAYDKTTGEQWANYYNVTTLKIGLGQYNNPYMYYDSPMIHTVTLTGLTEGKTYYYRVSGSCLISKFTIPIPGDQEGAYPQLVGITGDTGQTQVTYATFNALHQLNASTVIIVGDLSYADGWPALWDSFGNLVQNLASNTPLLTNGGNHDVGSSEAWQSYRHRYPTAHKGSNSPNFCYWGKEVGVMHVITLCSNAGTSNTSLQYQWLEQYLATSIDRTRTPWVVVQMHAPLYNSNNGHWMEGELTRLSMETMLYNYGVDLVLAGHVHSYERTKPVFNNNPNQCGPVYLVIGDGGNYEGPYGDWRVPPTWTAFREASFGIGELNIVNSTHAKYSWHRHACGSSDASAPNYYQNFSDTCVTPGDSSDQNMLTVDETWIVRLSQAICQNKYVSTASSSAYDDNHADSSSSSSDSDWTSSLSVTEVIFIILTVTFFASSCILAYFLIQSRKSLANKHLGEMFEKLLPDSKSSL